MSLTRCSEGRRRRRGRRPRPSSAWPSSSPSPGSASAAARPASPGTNQMWAYRHVTTSSANHSPPACPGRAAGSWRAPRSRAAARCCCWCGHSDPPRPRARGEPRAARWAWSRVTCHVTRSSSRRIQGDTDSSDGRPPGSGCSVLGALDTALMWSLTGDNIWNNLKHTQLLLLLHNLFS